MQHCLLILVHIKQRVGAESLEAASGEGGVRVVRLFHEGNEFEALLLGAGRRAAGPIIAIRKKLKEAGIETPLPTLAMIALASAVGVFVMAWVFTQHVPGAMIAGGGASAVRERAGERESHFVRRLRWR